MQAREVAVAYELDRRTASIAAATRRSQSSMAREHSRSRYGLVMPRALWGKAPFVLLQHWSILAAVVCSSALVAMAAAGGPLLRAAVESESLKAKLAELSPLGAGLTIETKPAPGNARTDAARRAAARKLGLRLPSTRRPIVTTTGSAQVGGQALEGGIPLYVVPMARDGARAHVRLVQGRSRSGVLVAESVARLARVTPGRPPPARRDVGRQQADPLRLVPRRRRLPDARLGPRQPVLGQLHVSLPNTESG